VAEHQLDRPQVGPALEQVRRERVPQDVRAERGGRFALRRVCFRIFPEATAAERAPRASRTAAASASFSKSRRDWRHTAGSSRSPARDSARALLASFRLRSVVLVRSRSAAERRTSSAHAQAGSRNSSSNIAGREGRASSSRRVARSECRHRSTGTSGAAGPGPRGRRIVGGAAVEDAGRVRESVEAAPPPRRRATDRGASPRRRCFRDEHFEGHAGQRLVTVPAGAKTAARPSAARSRAVALELWLPARPHARYE